jgi:hypothetical protein
MQKMHRSVSGPDQAWFLGELDRYLEASPATTAEVVPRLVELEVGVLRSERLV